MHDKLLIKNSEYVDDDNGGFQLYQSFQDNGYTLLRSLEVFVLQGAGNTEGGNKRKSGNTDFSKGDDQCDKDRIMQKSLHFIKGYKIRRKNMMRQHENDQNTFGYG